MINFNSVRCYFTAGGKAEVKELNDFPSWFLSTEIMRIQECIICLEKDRILQACHMNFEFWLLEDFRSILGILSFLFPSLIETSYMKVNFTSNTGEEEVVS